MAVLVLLLPALSGCLAGPSGDDAGGTGIADVAPPDVPDDAELVETDAGFSLRWSDVELPLEAEVAIPEGVTMVRARAVVDDDQRLFVDLRHAETGRRRCNTPYIADWQRATTGEMTCSGLTAVDVLPTNWTLTVSAPTSSPILPTEEEPPAPRAELVEVELRTTSLSGPVAQLDLAELSMPTHALQPTEQTRVASFDGTELYVEVTLPEGDGPWPTVLASSPYNSGYHAAGEPAMWEYFVQDWAMRGYAVVVADVRGTGRSDGCMEVWGPNEQADQVVLVEWIADRAWSDGHVGFYGQSYVGTTPVEAAVQAPDALKAIIAVAPVINAYDDWHFGGVPNGENVGSPVFYQSSTGGISDLEMADPARSAVQVANGLCDPTLTARANDPRAVYDAFYEVRDFGARAGDVRAAVMYTHGFEDPNVKSSMAVPWFNDLTSPKLGLFGHWTHQHPPRADTEALMLAWMDQYVKGQDLGLDDLPAAIVRTNLDTERTDETWPPADPAVRTLWPDLGEGAWSADGPADGEASLFLRPDAAVPAAGATRVVVEGAVDEAVHLAGTAKLHLSASLAGAPNGHVAAFLYDVPPDGSDEEPVLVTWGMANLAHRDGHERWEAVPPGEVVVMDLPFLPTEHVVQANHTLRLVVRGAHHDDWFLVDPGPPGELTLHGGEDGVALHLPLAPNEAVTSPLTGLP